MKITIINFWNIWEPHFVTILEIAEKHLLAGDTVEIIACCGELSFCDGNWHGSSENCFYCVRKYIEGFGNLSGEVKLIPLAKLQGKDFDKQWLLSTDWNKESLQQAFVEDLDCGYGVLSSFISHYRNSNINFTGKQNKVKEMLINSIDIYFKIYNYLKTAASNRVYLFNGRYAYYRAAFRAVKKRGIKIYCHERGCDIQHYSNYEDVMPHDTNNFHQKMINAWSKAIKKDKKLAYKIGASFYEERKKKVEQSWYSFVSDQDENCLPSSWDYNKYNIVIYNSSEDEFEAIGSEWQHLLYTNQLTGIKQILDDIKGKSNNIMIYLRMHPNLKDADQEHVKLFCDLHYPFFEIIPPDSPVDSYYLLQQCDKILTFGSTIGIEAVYFEKPSILADLAFYRNLNGTYNPETHEELMKLLLDQHLSPLNKAKSIIYGYYLKTYGIKFIYAQGITIFRASFKGHEYGRIKTYKFIFKNIFNCKYLKLLCRCVYNIATTKSRF